MATVTPINKKAATDTPEAEPRTCPACGRPLEPDAPASRSYCAREDCRKARAVAASKRSRAKHRPTPARTTAELIAPSLAKIALGVDRIEQVLSGELTGDPGQTASELKDLARRLNGMARKLEPPK